MKKDIELLPPHMPNFIRITINGEKLPAAIPIEDLNEEEASRYGELMKQTFINHWKKKKQ